jgi:hypothetical protein
VWVTRVRFTLEQTQRGRRGIAILLSLTSTLDRVGGQLHAPTTLPPGTIRYTLYRRLDGPQGRSGKGGGKFPLPSIGIRSPDRPARRASYLSRHPDPCRVQDL